MVRRRGATYMEVLAAMLITSMGVAAIFGLYTFVMGQVLSSHRVVIAGELARADLEKVKVMGFAFFPKATTFTQGTCTMSGIATCVSASWSGPTSYYDATGTLLASTEPTWKRVFSLQRTGVEEFVTVSGGAYEIKDGGMRKVTTTVRLVADNSVAAADGIILTKRGL